MALIPKTTTLANGGLSNDLVFREPNGYTVAGVALDSNRALYRASAIFVPQATAAVVLFRFQGSATKTCRITRIAVEGVSSANANIPIALQRESTAGSGGTEVKPTIAKMDTGHADATGVVAHYTSTLVAAGTAVGGPLWSGYLSTNVVTTPTLALPRMPIFPEVGSCVQALVVRGAAEFIVLKNTNGGNLSTGTNVAYSIEWIEDDS